MSNILTAEEVLDDVWRKIHKKYPNSLWTKSAEQAMIEFAKLHVEAALKEANKVANNYVSPQSFGDALITSYPLTNIK